MRNYTSGGGNYFNYNYNGYSNSVIQADMMTPPRDFSKSDKVSKAKKRLLAENESSAQLGGGAAKRNGRAKKRRLAEKLEKECSCRFCYEDHILRMRWKQAKVE